MIARKPWLHAISDVLAVVLVLALAPSVNAADRGMVRKNGVELYRDGDGGLHPIVVVGGIQYVEFPLELIPLKDLQGDGRVVIPPPAAGVPKTAMSPVRYSQLYCVWAGTKLGNSTTITIGDQGCYLTSTAMMVATYGSQLEGDLTTPLSLNTWMKNHGGFGGSDGASLIFGAIVNLPGGVVSSVSYFNDWYSAQLCMYYGYVPIIKLTTSNGNTHFCAFVQTTGTKNLDTDWIINPLWSLPAQIEGIRQTVRHAGGTYLTSEVFRVGIRG